MHAIVTVFKHPAERYAEQTAFLHERIIPMVKEQPGFESGSWAMDHEERRSYSYLVWTSEEAANKFASFLRTESARPNPMGVELESVRVVEVLGDARRP